MFYIDDVFVFILVFILVPKISSRKIASNISRVLIFQYKIDSSGTMERFILDFWVIFIEGK